MFSGRPHINASRRHWRPIGDIARLAPDRAMVVRLLAIASTLALGQLGTLWIARGYSIGEVVPPTHEPSQLPLQMAMWTGEELPANPRIQRFLRARAGVDRCYRDPTGREINAHVVWTDDYIRIHFPEQCYSESGWTQTGSQSVQVDSAGVAPFPAKIVTFERENEQIQVLYWFQLGDEFFFDRVTHRTLRRRLCWGQRRWPPLVKVMLQTSSSATNPGDASLCDLGGLIFAWTKAGEDRSSASGPPSQ